jgi:hypothetical protein
MKNPFKPGDHFYKMNIGPGMKLKSYKCHILSIVDKEYVVFKWWSISNQRWRYSIQYFEYVIINSNHAKRWKEKNET